MSNAKIEISFGSLSFSGEGEEDWLAKQLDKVLSSAVELSELHAPSSAATDETKPDDGGKSGGTKFDTPLGTYIREKGGEGNQTKRFLVTADWLRLRGQTPLTTALVTKSLTDNHQTKLGNPAQCLNENVSKGFCEKTPDGFYITPPGLKELGHTT